MTTTDRDIEEAVAGLRTGAPATLRPGVLAEVGLADLYARFDSPLGPLVVAWNGLGVSVVEEAEDDTTFEEHHLARTGRPAYDAGSVPPRLATAIARRLDGDRRARIDLDLRGHTEFERDVWLKALEIPRGEVRPYGWIAAEIGRPKAVRAVGSALGHNPVPLIVPCHRVVRSDGAIGQYSLGGPDNKRTMLEAEGLDLPRLEQLWSSGVRFIGSDTTKIYCLPTCRHARRVTDRHRLGFRSAAEGEARGYRACRVCRPASAAVAA
ncbi:MAG: methylated-DNA--[protein]-cysteine S-methyltransferase [Chloroflexota bacterium]